MQPIQLFDPDSSTYTYLLFDPISRDAVVIDPVDEQLERDLAVITQHGLYLRWVIETHAHADHITSAALLAPRTGAVIAAPAGCGIRTAPMQIKPGDELPFGAQRLQALATPGHTAGSLSYRWVPQVNGQPTPPGHVFTGDALLINGCGRTDFQSGNPHALYHSLTQVLFKLPPDTVVWPAHDYNGRHHSTIGAEAATNARVAGKTEAEFVALMNSLQLPMPRRIAEAVPANLRSGLRHDAGAPPGPVPAGNGYAGDITPETAFAWWQAGQAVLVDVRSDAEREWVGFVPGAVPLAWKQWPGMVMNETFDAGLQTAMADAPDGSRVLMLCRSGARSIAAAQRATQLGFEAYNILEGFEGDADEQRQRSKRGGWRYRGLPWQQN